MKKNNRIYLVLGVLLSLNLSYSCSAPTPNTTGNLTRPSVNSSSKATQQSSVNSNINPANGKIRDTPEKSSISSTINNINSVPADNSSNNSQNQTPQSVPTNYIPYPTNSTQPSGQTGSTSDTKERATFNGRIYDKNGQPVDGATVTARSIDPGVDWVGEAQVTVGGAYVFRNAPVGARIEISAEKSGLATIKRDEVLKSNLNGDPTANVFDFTGIYSLTDSSNGGISVSGKAYDASGKQINEGTVKIEYLDGSGTTNQTALTVDGYHFDVPANTRVKITITTKDGKTKSREESVGNNNAVFNFGGGNDPNFAISSQQDNFFVDYGVNPYIDPNYEKQSTFSVDVDTASYTWMRKSILDENTLPARNSVRIEEYINFFDYGYPMPNNNDSFTINTDLVQSPIGENNSKILRIGLQGKSLNGEARKPAALTFVIDISGSMSSQDNRLELVKKTLNLLVDNLNNNDKISIVVFGTDARVLLNSTSAGDKATIKQAINSLQTEGSTNTEAGLLLGFDMATKNFVNGASNRVILCSDGVANVGATGPDKILQEIKQKSESGISLSTFGFGMGNYNDTLMEQLANKGDGSYAYVDNLDESYRVFSAQIDSTLQTLAKDVKVQVEFDPESVSKYRLIGYENRNIQNQDFRNDNVDAGEIGINNSVTALYEVELKNNVYPSNKIAEVFLRYKDSNDYNKVKEFQKPVYGYDLNNNFTTASPSFKMATAIAMYGEILRHSYWAKDARYSDVTRITKEAEVGYDNSKKISEFLNIVDKASKLPLN